MWVYGDKSLEHRLKLDPLIGYWIDYWLHLHADETYPIWCSRPLGIRAIAIAALESQDSNKNRVLRKQLKQEMRLIEALVSHLKCIPNKPNDSLEITEGP